MKRTLFWVAMAALVLLCRTPTAEATMTYGLSHYTANRAYLGSGNYNDPLYNFINEVETGVLGSVSATTLTFSTYAGTFDNATNNAFEWNENSDELIWTFGSNTVTASSGDVTLFDYGTIVLGFDQFKVNATTYTFPTSDGTSGQVLQTNASGVLSWAANGGGISDLDGAYNGGATIDVDGDAVTLTVSDTDNNVGLVVVQNDSTNDPTAMQITSAADLANAIALDIDGQTTGRDIEGTGASFYVEGDGSIVGVDADLTGAAGITLQNDATILNDVDTEIQLADGTEDISFGFGTSNTLTITSDTLVDTVNWGDVDAFSGMSDITFDTGATATLTLPSTGAAEDLTLSVTGATNSSLVLASSGTGTDALTVTASAGGIDISSQEDVDITTTGAAGEDITIQNSGGSINIEATEADAAAIVINASTAVGGIDITSNADIDITTTGEAGEDISITNTGGSVNISATENDAAAMTIGVNGGASESLNLFATQGTGEDAIDIDATAGGIDIDFATGKNMAVTGGQFIVTSNEAVASAINLVTNTGAAETIVVTNSQGTGAGAITLASTLGGVNVDAAAALDVDIAGGQVALVSKDNAASAISLTANVGGSETIVVTNTQGIAEGAIALTSTAGGVDIDAAAAKNIDVAGGQVLISSKDASASAIALTANVGAAETIVITNTQGNTAGAVTVTSSAGGITLDASSGVVFTQGQTRHQTFDIASVTLDGTNPPTLVELGTDGQAQFAALSFDADGGATGNDTSYITWLVPDGYVVDSARLNIGYSFSTAEDAADEAQFDFTVNAVGQNEAYDAAGTALADQTTVIADGTTDNAKLHTSQYNIEVEDIAVGDYVHIEIEVDESASALTASSTLDVHYIDIEWESTE